MLQDEAERVTWELTDFFMTSSLVFLLIYWKMSPLHDSKKGEMRLLLQHKDKNEYR